MFANNIKSNVGFLQCFLSRQCGTEPENDCYACPKMDDTIMKKWSEYVDYMENNDFTDHDKDPIFYKRMKENPNCCTFNNQTNPHFNFCTATLKRTIIAETKSINQFYHLECETIKHLYKPKCDTEMGCCQTDFCNLINNSPFQKPSFEIKTVVVLIILLAFVIAAGVFVVCLYYKYKHKFCYKANKEAAGSVSSPMLPPFSNPGFAESTSMSTYPRRPGDTDGSQSGVGEDPRSMVSGSFGLTYLMEDTCTGSGSGLPLLTQRTVARQVHLLNKIGEGRYGEVWKAQWQGDLVAVKKFVTRDEKSWFRETEMYQTAMLRHDNILGFVAADNMDTGISTELWLITNYHPAGSLCTYLHTNTLTPKELLIMASSIANGLSHLHMEICGTQGKPPIAHRDLKSRNILVKSNGECCIADLGLAVRHDPVTGLVNLPQYSARVGTRRYMAPEVLDSSMPSNSFDAYVRADIYSLGLVYWEMARRVSSESGDGLVPEAYEMPYQGLVPNDPQVEDMKKVVCDENIRPPLSPRWSHHPILATMEKIMCECWNKAPDCRPTSMRTKKTLKNALVLHHQPSSFDPIYELESPS